MSLYYEQKKVFDENGLINPAQDETIILLRRICKLCEAKSIAPLISTDNSGSLFEDSGNQPQRVVCGGLSMSGIQPTSSQLNTVGVLMNSGTTGLGQGRTSGSTIVVAPTEGSSGGNMAYQMIWPGPVDIRWLIANDARMIASNCLREQLS